MKKIRRSRRVLAGMLAVMMVAGAAPINLGSVGLFNTTISPVQATMLTSDPRWEM
jgi:hypothetical protein